MASYFKLIYHILKLLEKKMEYEEFDNSRLNAEALGISEALWRHLMKMLVDNGYIEGVSLIQHAGNCLPGIKLNNPNITLKGLEYLEENSLMQKAKNLVKGIVEVI